MSARSVLVLLALSGAGLAQRGSYVKRPVGYPEITTSTTSAPLGNRFGEDQTSTTVRLPAEALGDRELVERLSKLPVDKQPFWLLNWQALEDNRNNPQSYQPNPVSFVDPFGHQHTQQNVQTQNTQTQNAANIDATSLRWNNGQLIPQKNGNANNFASNGQILNRNLNTNSPNNFASNGQMLNRNLSTNSPNNFASNGQMLNRNLSTNSLRGNVERSRGINHNGNRPTSRF